MLLLCYIFYKEQGKKKKTTKNSDEMFLLM